MSQTEYRDEQMWATEIIKMWLPQKYTLHLEVELTDLKPVDGIKIRLAKPDIVLINHVDKQKIAIRVNGTFHHRKAQKMKDANQKIVLEGNGWTVVDFNVDEMPNLFSNDRLDSTHRREAFTEVLSRLDFLWDGLL